MEYWEVDWISTENQIAFTELLKMKGFSVTALCIRTIKGF
jgi:hypothetical protein